MKAQVSKLSRTIQIVAKHFMFAYAGAILYHGENGSRLVLYNKGGRNSHLFNCHFVRFTILKSQLLLCIFVIVQVSPKDVLVSCQRSSWWFLASTMYVKESAKYWKVNKTAPPSTPSFHIAHKPYPLRSLFNLPE